MECLEDEGVEVLDVGLGVCEAEGLGRCGESVVEMVFFSQDVSEGSGAVDEDEGVVGVCEFCGEACGGVGSVCVFFGFVSDDAAA